MSVLLPLLQFRAKQGFRMLQSIGFGVFLVLLPIAFLGGLLLLQFLYTTPEPWAGILLLVALFAIHYQRGDRFFLEQLTTHTWQIYALEYLLLWVPFAICFIIWSQWWNIGIGLVGIAVLAGVAPPYQQQKVGSAWGSWMPVAWIPSFLWEWRAGFRSQGLFWGLLYFLCFLGIQYTFVTPVLTLILALSVCYFYQAVAPKEIIQTQNSDGRLLIRKLYYSCLFFQALLLPHYVLFWWHHSSFQILLGIIGLVFLSTSWISFSICLQYSDYTYDKEESYNVVPFAIFTGGCLIPFLWPVLPFFWWSYWRKAVQQLNFYA
ncbi:MAG: hypothetical protein AB8E82_06695 [Aureispira sp.]